MSPIPSFLEPKPKPMLDARLYHGNHVSLWRGVVHISQIKGWANNPRLEIEMKGWKDQYPGAEIDQDGLYHLMKSTSSIKLKQLAANIAANGLREPVVLTFDGELLDGNRRYFATRLARDNERDTAKKERLALMPVFVLQENASDKERQNILVEENFSASHKIEWPDYVKAQHIRRAYDEERLSITDIADKYGWSESKVRDTLKIAEITDAFISYAVGEPNSEEGGGGLGMEELAAEKIATEHYQYFNEAKKSFFGPLKNDPDFAELFYNRVAQGNFFNSFHEVRCAYEGYGDDVGREIMKEGDASGGKDLKALIQYKKRNTKRDKAVEENITAFVAFLEKISAKEMQDISDAAFKGLQDALTRVQNMVAAGRNKND